MIHALALSLALMCAHHDQVVADQARQVGVPVPLAQAVMRVESACNPLAVSATGARGLMQVMPFWLHTNLAAKCGSINLHRPAVGACFGTRILRYYVVKNRGSWPRALYGYSGGNPDYLRRVRRELLRVPGDHQAALATIGPLVPWPTARPYLAAFGRLWLMLILWSLMRSFRSRLYPQPTTAEDLGIMLGLLLFPLVAGQVRWEAYRQGIEVAGR